MKKTTTDLSGSWIRHLMHWHHYFRSVTRLKAAWGGCGSDTMGTAAQCPASSYCFRDGGAHWGAPRTAGARIGCYFVPSRIVHYRWENSACPFVLFCLLVVWEPSCFKNRKEKCGKKCTCSLHLQRKGICVCLEQRIYFWSSFSQSLLWCFCFCQGDALCSMCPKCALHIASLLHPAHTQCTPSFVRLWSNSYYHAWQSLGQMAWELWNVVSFPH